MNANEFRKELVKIMPGYHWIVGRTKIDGYMSAIGTKSSGFNRLSTLSVSRREHNGEIRYETKSAGFGRHAQWLHTTEDRTIARALRRLQNHYDTMSNTYRVHAEHLKSGRFEET